MQEKLDKIEKMETIIDTDYSNMAGIVVMKDGKAVYENYFHGCTQANRFNIFSATKSILSILVGIAIDKGYLDGIDRKILDFYPEYIVKRGEKTIQNITIRDMLTMTVPYKYKYNPFTKYFTSEDWV